MRQVILRSLAVAAAMLSWYATAARAQTTQTIFTDADAGARIICRNDYTEAACYTALGDNGYIRVHDQNQLETGYWHFDLGDLNPTATVTSARFQLDTQTNSWGDTAVTVLAVVDPNNDWDLGILPESEINGATAPFSDQESYEWTGDPDNDGQQRFNSPTPFLDEGDKASSPVRALVPIGDFLLIENQDPNTVDETNDYGGYVTGDSGGPGEAGSADYADNIWPEKNTIDLDITDLVQWKMGQNPAYSDFDPVDRELTLMVRTEFGLGDNGFAWFISKESGFLGGDLDLAPGRIVVTSEGGGILGDFNMNGMLDLPDVNMLNANIAAGGGDPAFDLNGDGNVDQQDLTVWVSDLKNTWFGDADLNGEFNSGDLVAVFQANKFELNEDATWEQGDWNGDLRFGSGDLVRAFQDNGFEMGPRPASAVPEPGGLILLGLAAAGLMLRRQSRSA